MCKRHFWREHLCALQVLLCALVSRPVSAHTRAQLRGNIDLTLPLTINRLCVVNDNGLLCALFSTRFTLDLVFWLTSSVASNSAFINSGYFYSASSSPLLVRGAPDDSIDTVLELTRQSTADNYELWTYLLKDHMWWLEWD